VAAASAKGLLPATGGTNELVIAAAAATAALVLRNAVRRAED
jgi:hypothetical protein